MELYSGNQPEVNLIFQPKHDLNLNYQSNVLDFSKKKDIKLDMKETIWPSKDFVSEDVLNLCVRKEAKNSTNSQPLQHIVPYSESEMSPTSSCFSNQSYCSSEKLNENFYQIPGQSISPHNNVDIFMPSTIVQIPPIKESGYTLNNRDLQPDSSNDIKVVNPLCVSFLQKSIRPFKAYPKDPTVFGPVTRSFTEIILDQESKNSYNEFRQHMLSRVRSSNNVQNTKMRRNIKNRSNDMSDSDLEYLERRKKNNEAAKRSRDARRAKEDEIAIRAAFLEQENIKLKYECAALREEVLKLKSINNVN